MMRVEINIRNHIPMAVLRIQSNVNRLLHRIGSEITTSARRSIQNKAKAAEKGRPPRNVTGKLKAGIDFRVRNGVLSMLVHPAPTNPPKSTRRRRGVPQWLERNHPYIRPAATRVIARLQQILASFPLTK